jgi:predicted DsbA family dithiol-disulfide isomerase
MQADATREHVPSATGVPLAVIERSDGVPGAQPAELLLEALETAHHSGVVAGG